MNPPLLHKPAPHPARFFLQKEPRQMDAASLSPAQVGDDAILAL